MSDRLVWIGLISKIDAIPDADKIQLATVVCGSGGKWLGIVKKNEFQVGDTCQVYLPDSQLPQTPEFSFMAKYKYIVRMVRLRGVPSECLITQQTLPGNVGDDITELAGVLKYEKPVPLSLRGENFGNFPSFIPRTDELNFQSAPLLVNALRGEVFYATEKADGTSTTVYRSGDHFGVCSRNWEKKESDVNALWRLAKEYKVEDWLPEGVALQWETVGPGIQSNPLGLKKLEPRLFNLWFINESRYGNLDELKAFADRVPLVTILEEGNIFDPAMTDEQLRVYAEGVYSNGKQREGVVFRPTKEKVVHNRKTLSRVSFKVINLKYG